MIKIIINYILGTYPGMFLLKLENLIRYNLYFISLIVFNNFEIIFNISGESEVFYLKTF